MNAIFLKTEDLVLEYTKLKYPENSLVGHLRISGRDVPVVMR